jgi:hypothetical protein
MRRIVFLAIAAALILGVASPSFAVRPIREWDDPSRSTERGTGASGDDDLPSKDVTSVPTGNPTPARQSLESRLIIHQPKTLGFIKSFAIRIGWGRVLGQRTRVQQ